MTTTNEILKRLATGELQTMKFAETGEIVDASSVENVVSKINDGLRDLYTRFLLSKREIVIQTSPTLLHYYLRPEFMASSGSSQPIKYILNGDYPDFDGRIAKILDIYDGFGRQLFINKSQEPLSVFTPEYDCIQITANHETEQFYVIYQALHPIVNSNNVENTPINLPPSLEYPLTLLVASKVYSDMNGKENAAKGITLFQKYETALLEADFRDTHSVSENTSNSKLEAGGFV